MRFLGKTVLTLGLAALATAFTFGGERGEPRPRVAPLPADASAPVIPMFLDPFLREADAAEPPQALRFLTSDDFPPFNFTDGRGRLGGYHVELARAICRELDIPCTIQARPFHTLAQSLSGNSGDAVIAGIRETEGLRRLIDFTAPYLRIPARFAAPDGGRTDATPQGLAGARVGVVAGTPHEAFLEASFPDSRASPFADTDAALSALAAGEVDVVFADALSLSYWLVGPAGSDCCTFIGGPYIDAEVFGGGLSIAVGSGDTALAALLERTLARLEGRGVLAELYLKYFPLGLY